MSKDKSSLHIRSEEDNSNEVPTFPKMNPEDEIIMILRDFSENNYHEWTTGFQRHYAKAIIDIVNDRFLQLQYDYECLRYELGEMDEELNER